MPHCKRPARLAWLARPARPARPVTAPWALPLRFSTRRMPLTVLACHSSLFGFSRKLWMFKKNFSSPVTFQQSDSYFIKKWLWKETIYLGDMKKAWNYLEWPSLFRNLHDWYLVCYVYGCCFDNLAFQAWTHSITASYSYYDTVAAA